MVLSTKDFDEKANSNEKAMKAIEEIEDSITQQLKEYATFYEEKRHKIKFERHDHLIQMYEKHVELVGWDDISFKPTELGKKMDQFSDTEQKAIREAVIRDAHKAGWSISWEKKVEQVDKDKLCRSSKHRVRSEELSEYLKKNPIQVLEIG
ncbi:MAG: hypothetical protein N4R51_08980 [Lactobacillus crispatus]|nr:hypothetical protein [Lactobacillus crispatus]